MVVGLKSLVSRGVAQGELGMQVLELALVHVVDNVVLELVVLVITEDLGENVRDLLLRVDLVHLEHPPRDVVLEEKMAQVDVLCPRITALRLSKRKRSR